MNFNNEKIAVLFGSQTGNAQDVAERIWRDSKRFYFRTTIKPLNDYNVLNLENEACVIFICSTTGQGEEPDNMKAFWRFMLKRNLSVTLLNNLRCSEKTLGITETLFQAERTTPYLWFQEKASKLKLTGHSAWILRRMSQILVIVLPLHVRFAVFGLGDSSYTKFNFVAKRLYRRLLQLGAKPLIPLGLGDDQHDLGYDGAADPWMEDLWKALSILYPLPAKLNPLPSDYFITPRWCIKTLQPDNIGAFRRPPIFYSTRKNNELLATVLENKRLTAPDHFQDVRLVKLETDGKSYGPGDVISLLPQNLPSQIDEFKKVLSSNGVVIPPDTVFSLSQNDPEIPVPDVLKYNVTFDQLCSEYFDLMTIPRRHTFKILAQLTDSELERERCLEFASAEGQEDFYSYAHRPKRNIVEVLADFPHATSKLTKEMLFEILPPIKPRDFSIASNFKVHSNKIEILMAIVKYKTKLKKERLGLASNYLGSLEEGTKIMARIKGGSFRFPNDHKVPVIMVGPGTGVAPFRNYVYERSVSSNSTPENLILFYGCRNKEKDFLCREEFEKFQSKGILTLFTAFSRDGPTKEYVQDKIRENNHLIWRTLERDGYIFVAGNAKNMPQGVRKAFADLCIECGKLSETEAEIYLQHMEKTGRYQTECW